MNAHPDDKLASTFAPADNAAAIAHLNMLQAIVARLAGNSVQCKTWCLAIVSALIGFAGAVKNDNVVAVALVPIIIFAFVDTSYLAHESAYRGLYNEVSAKIRGGSYRLSDCFLLNAPVTPARYLAALRSWSIWPIYLGLIAAYALTRCTGLLSW